MKKSLELSLSSILTRSVSFEVALFDFRAEGPTQPLPVA
jgi:hypothetical protein